KKPTFSLLAGFPNENQGGGQRRGYQRPQTGGAYGGNGGQQSSSYGQAAQSSGGYGGRKKRQGGYGPAPASTGGSSSYPAPGPQPPPPAPGYGGSSVQQKPPAKVAGKIFQSPTLPPKDCGIVDF
uniref:Uncharacterized protein n=1 Tax=Romanomermis culicivorax TaxID=13658 RepID=A0A915JBJ5_ROMCU